MGRGGGERGVGRDGDRGDEGQGSTADDCSAAEWCVSISLCVSHLCLLPHFLQQGREVVRDLCHVIALRAVHIHIDAEGREGGREWQKKGREGEEVR